MSDERSVASIDSSWSVLACAGRFFFHASAASESSCASDASIFAAASSARVGGFTQRLPLVGEVVGLRLVGLRLIEQIFGLLAVVGAKAALLRQTFERIRDRAGVRGGQGGIGGCRRLRGGGKREKQDETGENQAHQGLILCELASEGPDTIPYRSFLARFLRTIS